MRFKVLFLIGVLLCCFPYISNWFETRQYEDEYKEYQSGTHAELEENEIIGFLEIPRIDALLPIYPGTETATLEKGIGHVEGSSLPVGEEGTHCVLVGHRGLFDRELFLHLDDLQLGDKFYIEAYEKRLVYEVSDIYVVKPEETETLMIQPYQDIVSLVTCTPYGMNTHRLIVQGERKESE